MTQALIIGGGIAGAVTAMALRQAGIGAVIYEAYPTGADDVGAFLTVMSNGLDALRAVRAEEAVRAESFPARRAELVSGTGKRLGELNLTAEPGRPGPRTLSRAGLYRVLHDEAARRGIRIEHGKRCTGATTAQDGRVRATFADGTTAEGDLLIGADGVHSAIRPLIDPAAPRPRYAERNTVCGYTPGAWATPTDTYRMIYGRRAFFGCTTAPDGTTWWFANVPAAERPRAELGEVPLERGRREFSRLFARDRTPAAELVAGSERIVVSNAYDLGSVPTWHRDSMIIIGDAAHAATPEAAQGASMAVEDSVVLAKCLRDREGTGAAFAEYERLRRQRVESLVATSAGMSANATPGPVKRMLRDLVLPRKLRKAGGGGGSTGSFAGYHIDWDREV
ncbi:FAD-dependent oxidoreductase [Amycolatopsis aidingensis]|uniref:FAD-dependent oxidoreductase n=1 Tax=Amycolatopsis aidingensis TaxID=2842453 RepID=UPI001C0CAF32|nr:NAD(P)/FAD-dependent oxidoreductase [Amycolatopsis aidingensis]